MSTINERISKIVKASGLSKTAFANKINVSQQYISKLTKEGIPSDRTIIDICREFNVNEEWLRFNKGSMPRKLDKDQEFELICNQICISDPLIKEILISYWQLSDDQKAGVKEFIKSVAKNINDLNT